MKKISFVPAACLIACGASLSSALAQSNTQSNLPEIVVTANLLEQKIQDTLPSATLITRADIDLAQTPDLPTLLSHVAGIQISQVGGMGQAVNIYMRGSNNAQTLVLIDGIPINNQAAGGTALQWLPLAMVDHIEVVRGNVSALYGSSALGGVIQIFTRQATNVPQVSVSAQVGSYGLRQEDAFGAIKLSSGTSLAATLESVGFNGFPAINANQLPGVLSVNDGFSRLAESFSIRQDIGSGSIGLKVRNASGSNQYDPENSPDIQSAYSNYQESGTVLDAKFKLNPDLDFNAALSTMADNFYITGGTSGFYNYTANLANANIVWHIASNQSLTAGLDETRQSANNVSEGATTRKEDSLRLGYVGQLGDRNQHDVQVNVRSDHYTDFGTANTGLLGYGYHLTDALRLNASYSTGFNAPTFEQLYYPGYSNPNLLPEQLHSSELGMQYVQFGQEIRVIVFHNTYSNLIALGNNYVPYNIGSATNNGIELSYKGKIGNTNLHSDLTLQNPLDTVTNTQIQRRAKTLAHFGGSQNIGQWTLGGELVYNSSSPDTAFNPFSYVSSPVTLSSYTVAGLTANYKISKEWSAFGRIDNLTNAIYQTAYSYNQPARSFSAGLRWTPKL